MMATLADPTYAPQSAPAEPRPRTRAAKRKMDAAAADADDDDEEEATLGSSFESPKRAREGSPSASLRAKKKQRLTATWSLAAVRALNQITNPDLAYESLQLVRILTQNCRVDADCIQAVICLMTTARHADGGAPAPRQVVAKLLATRLDPGGEDRAWNMRSECAASVIMSDLVKKRIAPGLVEVFGAYAGLETLRLPGGGAGDRRWIDMDRSMHLAAPGNSHKRVSFSAIVSEFIEGGLARDVLGARALQPGVVTLAALIPQLYGQLQWTLAAVHGTRLVHSDVQSENVLVRTVPSDANTAFDLPAYDVRYRFLNGPPGSTSLLLKLADYGITDVAATELASVPTARNARAPEYFGAYNPVAPDRRTHTRLYTQLQSTSDIWSGAIVFMTMLCGGIIPGFGAHCGSFHNVVYDGSAMPRKHFALPDGFFVRREWDPPRGFAMAYEQQIRRWEAMSKDKTLPRGAIDRDEVSMATSDDAGTMACALWRIAMLLGVPTPAQWPDMAHMPLMQLLRAFDPSRLLDDAPKDPQVMPRRMALLYNKAIDTYAPDMTAQDRADLSALLAMQLQWDPSRRPKPHNVLKRPIMQRLCRAESILDQKGAPATTVWSINVSPITGLFICPQADAINDSVVKFSRILEGL